jgi:hypothetical protein
LVWALGRGGGGSGERRAGGQRKRPPRLLFWRGAGAVGAKGGRGSSVGASGHSGALKQWWTRAKHWTRRRRRSGRGGTALLVPAALHRGEGGVCVPRSSGAFKVGRTSRGRAGVARAGKYHGGYGGGQGQGPRRRAFRGTGRRAGQAPEPLGVRAASGRRRAWERRASGDAPLLGARATSRWLN